MDKISFQPSFSARPRINKIVPKAQDKFRKFCAGVESPTYMRYFTPMDEFSFPHLMDLSDQLKFVRNIRKMSFYKGNISEYFVNLFNLIESFKVANCDEMAEIMKTILKINKVKRCNAYSVFAKEPNGQSRRLDHCVVALNVPNSKQKAGKPFTPKDNVQIIDMWWPNGFMGNVKKAKIKYRIFGLKDDEQLMLKPINMLEINGEACNKILQNFPQLKIN